MTAFNMNREEMESQNNTSTQLEFRQAMTDFKIMFPNLDDDVIEAVLRSNNGAVDATIDQLLTMTADNESAEGQGRPGDNALPSYREAVDNVENVTNLFGVSSLSESGQEGGGPDLLSNISGLDMMGAAGGVPDQGAGAVSMRRIKKWDPPLLGKLPPDFLRLRGAPKPGHSYTHPDRHHPSGVGSSSSHSHKRLDHGRRQGHGAKSDPSDRNQQVLEDEKFAMMLQNEEFMRELRGNQEFMSALEEDHGLDPSSHDHHEYQHHQPDKPKELGSKRGHLGMDDALFRERLKNMGKTSKQKFSKLATMFRAGAGGGVGRVLGHAPAPSKDNLLLNADPVAHNRIEDSDSDDTHDTHCTTKVTLHASLHFSFLFIIFSHFRVESIN